MLRALIERLIPCAVAMLIVLVSAGCSGGGAPTHHDHGGTFDEIQAKADEMRASDDFLEARDALQGCLEDLGYLKVGGPDLVLLDGSTIPPGTRYMRGALLDYMIHREGCMEQTGFDDVVAKYGLADESPDPARVQLANELKATQMSCLAGRGYVVPEPKTHRGYLHFDFPIRSGEEEAAFQADLVACNREIWGTDFPPAY